MSHTSDHAKHFAACEQQKPKVKHLAACEQQRTMDDKYAATPEGLCRVTLFSGALDSQFHDIPLLLSRSSQFEPAVLLGARSCGSLVASALDVVADFRADQEYRDTGLADAKFVLALMIHRLESVTSLIHARLTLLLGSIITHDLSAFISDDPAGEVGDISMPSETVVHETGSGADSDSDGLPSSSGTSVVEDVRHWNFLSNWRHQFQGLMYAAARAEFFLAVSLFLDFGLLVDVPPDFFDEYLFDDSDRDFFYEWLVATSYYTVRPLALQQPLCRVSPCIS